MSTSELTGAALDWAVAKCEYDSRRYNYGSPCFNANTKRVYESQGLQQIGVNFTPSTDWKQGGPIIERARIAAIFSGDEWVAGVCTFVGSGGDPVFEGGLFSGSTPLIAAMRCYVASKLGATVEIPEELK